MANPFLASKDHKEIETAIIYEQAYIHDIGNAVAFTDGEKIFVNTDDNLTMLLPNYNHNFLKWILWHEKFHMELHHHKRYFDYIEQLRELEEDDEFSVTKDEVNIIMDILVHDSLSKMFPELVDIALENLAQMRDRNSLGYTFKTNTLEKMLSEYAEYKRKNAEHKKETSKQSGAGEGDGSKDKTQAKEEKAKDVHKSEQDDNQEEETKNKKGRASGGKSTTKEKAEDDKPEVTNETKSSVAENNHSKTDWSKLNDICTKEFLESDESDYFMKEINRLKNKKIKLGRLTKTLNGLATTKRQRTYRLPSVLQMSDGCIFKGKTQGKVELYLIFDASGSMSGEMGTFKDIISKSIPQAMNCACEWFAGYGEDVSSYKTETDNTGYTEKYFKAKFKDFIRVRASGGYSDDGDRVIELCYLAEQLGYSPIGVTDGGGKISWSQNKLKLLKRTILVGDNNDWLRKAKEINPHIQTLYIDI